MSARLSDEAEERGRLALQRMERSLVRAHRARPGELSTTGYAGLRYALGLARLHVLPRDGHETIELSRAPIRSLRDWLLNHLHDALRSPATDDEKLAYASDAAGQATARAHEARAALLAAHTDQFSSAMLDHEIAHRALVIVAGGGGGAGYVYAGAFACLDDAGLVPDYIVGNSMGAILGLMRAEKRHAGLNDHVTFAAKLRNRDLFSVARRRAEFGMPGLLHLHLSALHQRLSVGEFKRPLRLDEMEIPLDLVVAGLKQAPYERLVPTTMGHEGTAARFLPLPVRVAARLSRLTTFFRPDMVEPIVLGRSARTRAVHAVDAAGFSAAVPSILQYEPSPRAGVTREIFAELMHDHRLAALVDGGIADNVPARAAWRGVAAGRATTRNAYYLAFDCFLPHLDPKNAWLWPITQLVQGQMRTNRVYADTMVRFNRALSPVNLVPGVDGLRLAVEWGYQTMQDHLAEVSAMLEPVDLETAGVVP